MLRRFLACALALSACAHGRYFEPGDLNRFRVNETTRADAERALGPPYAVSQTGVRTTLVWMYGETGPFGQDLGARILKLVFGPDGKLDFAPTLTTTGKFIEPSHEAR